MTIHPYSLFGLDAGVIEECRQRYARDALTVLKTKIHFLALNSLMKDFNSGQATRNHSQMYGALLCFRCYLSSPITKVLLRGGSCAVDPLGNVLVEPDFSKELIQ